MAVRFPALSLLWLKGFTFSIILVRPKKTNQTKNQNKNPFCISLRVRMIRESQKDGQKM